MVAFIYGAGIGSRLGPKYNERPKILLEFGGRSILEWHVDNLVQVIIHHIVLVTGYQRDMVRAIIPGLQAHYDVHIEERFNPKFTEGSALSLRTTLADLRIQKDSILFMDGDVLYPAIMLKRLLDSSHETVLLLDRDYSDNDGDAVLVPVCQGRPAEFLKGWQGQADRVGESVGLFRIGLKDLPLLIRETECHGNERPCGESYDEVIRAMVVAGQFGYEDVTGIPWIEVDFPYDVACARDHIFPAIRHYDK